MFEIPVEDHFLSCYNYALLKAGVKWEPAHLNISKESLLSFLLSQCESISVPHDGDFVLFLQDGELVHLGLSQQGKILSKEGNACRFASLKRLEDLSSEYGNQVLYFRFSP